MAIPIHPVPTSVAVGPDGAFYVSELTGFPFLPGFSRIHRVVPGSPDGLRVGLTNVTDLAWHDGDLYAVQIADNGLQAGPIGSLVRSTRWQPPPSQVDCSRRTALPSTRCGLRDHLLGVPGGGEVIRIPLGDDGLSRAHPARELRASSIRSINQVGEHAGRCDVAARARSAVTTATSPRLDGEPGLPPISESPALARAPRARAARAGRPAWPALEHQHDLLLREVGQQQARAAGRHLRGPSTTVGPGADDVGSVDDQTRGHET